jgi:hypothetical protein
MDEVKVATAFSEVEADQLVMLLEAEGIPADHTGGTAQFGFAAEIDIRVPAEHAERARELVGSRP